MRILTLAGSGAQRGLDHGREQAGEIADTIAAVKAHLAASGHPPATLTRRLGTSHLSRTAADLVPDLWDEVIATATASHLPLEDVLLLTFLDEVWAMTGPGSSDAPIGCSVLARVIPGRPGRTDIGGLDDDAQPPTPPTTEIGQTMDLPAWASGRMTVLRVSDTETPAALVMAYPGSIGLCGANQAGLGVAVNALSRVPWSEDGLGVGFVLRALLARTTLAEAEAYLTSIPHAAGQAYTIAAPDGIATFEADAEGVRRVTAPGVPALAHTNHPLDDPEAPASESSRARLDLLLACLERRTPLADALTGDVVVDGTRWRDPYLTFGAFRAVGNELAARFADGTSLRAGRPDWSRITYV